LCAFFAQMACCDVPPAPTRVFLLVHSKFFDGADRVVTDLVRDILIAIVVEESSRFWAVLLEMCNQRHIRLLEDLKKI
jgi:hypothetical protein